MRGFVRTVAEIVQGALPGRPSDTADVMPRVHRGWTFAGLRAATNVLGRDLNTAIITEEMRKGTKQHLRRLRRLRRDRPPCRHVPPRVPGSP